MELPLRLARVSSGFAALAPAARDAGHALAAAAARALGEVLATPVRLDGSPLPVPADAARGMARVAVSLDGIPAMAALDVDVGFLARVLQRVAGMAAVVPAALTESAAERALLDLAALVIVDAARNVEPIAALHPRIALSGDPDPDALAVALDVTLGEERGRGRLLVPAAAVRALASSSSPLLPSPVEEVALTASFREGAASIEREELAALARGDVLLLDEEPPPSCMVFPGGLVAAGRVEGDLFHVQEIRMTETQATYPITVAVEIGRVTLTLGDLSRLEPGGALPLDLRRDGTVVLRAGERAIARGQLVEIGGALGVRIAELGERP